MTHKKITLATTPGPKTTQDQLKPGQRLLYRKTPLNKTWQQEQSETQLLLEHLKLIVHNHMIVLQEKRFFYIEFRRAFISLAYMSVLQLPLGVLVQMWRDPSLHGVCPDCASPLYIRYIGGSPLSGSNKITGLCLTCMEVKQTHWWNHFPMLWSPVLKWAGKSQNYAKVLQTTHRDSLFGVEVNPNPPTEEILVKQVTPAPLKELIRVLKLLP